MTRLRLSSFALPLALACLASDCSHADRQATERAVLEQLQTVQLAPRHIELAGQRIRFLEADGPDPVPLLFVHGIGGSFEDFLPLLTRASGKVRFFALDLPGFGGSSNPNADFHIEHLAESVRAFLEAVAVPRVHLVCHSLGGQVCIAFALAHTGRAQTLTLIDSAGTYDAATYMMKLTKRAAGLNVGTVQGTPALLGLFGGQDQTVVKRVFIDEATPLAALASFSTNFRSQTRRLALPTLVIWGTDDPVFPVEEAFTLKENIVGSTLKLVEGAGHLPFEKEPALVLRWILKHTSRSQPADSPPPPGTPTCTSP